MDSSALSDYIVSLGRSNPVILIVVFLALLFFVYRKPKLFLYVVGLALLLAVLYYFVMDIAGQGTARKKDMLQKTGQSNP